MERKEKSTKFGGAKDNTNTANASTAIAAPPIRGDLNYKDPRTEDGLLYVILVG